MIGQNKWRLIVRVWIAWEGKSRRVRRIGPSLFALTALSLYSYYRLLLLLTLKKRKIQYDRRYAFDGITSLPPLPGKGPWGSFIRFIR
jgi:hypothetical protein